MSQLRIGTSGKLLRKPRPYVFEFRHASWYEPDIIDLLREHDIHYVSRTTTTRRRPGK